MANRSSNNPTKAVVSVSEMARQLGLSRTHFHALIKSGVMPTPVYCLFTRRPLFTRELQEAAILVKMTNIGIDGRYVCFYSPRQPETERCRRDRQNTTAREAEADNDILSSLRSLGLSDVTQRQVDDAIRLCFPAGPAGIDEGLVLRAVWQHLRRSNPA